MERNLLHRRGEDLVVTVKVCHDPLLEGEDRADLRREKMCLKTDQGDFDHSGLQHLDNVVGVLLKHLKTDFRICFMVIEKDLLQQRIRVGRGTSETQGSAVSGYTGLDLFPGRIFQIADRFDFIVEDLSSICQLNMARLADYKLCTVGVFETLDLIAECRLCDQEFF